MAGLVVLGAYAVVLWRAPTWLVNQDLLHDPRLGPEHRLAAEHNARLIVISIGGALVVGTGLFYTARNYRLAHRGQVTERFTKALERLGAEQLYVRVGGIHALQHVMRDSPDHHGDVVEVLVSFVRDQVNRQSLWEEQEAQYPGGHDSDETFGPGPDVIAALNALAYRPRRVQHERGVVDLGDLRLGAVSVVNGDLRGMNLWGAYLADADLAGVQFQDGELMHAELRGACLDGADLRLAHFLQASCFRARLRGAKLQRAVLTNVDLRQADLTGAHLEHAGLYGAQLERAKLQGAFLMHADLRTASLAGAHLEGADLRHADIEAGQLLDAVLDSHTKLSDELADELAERRRELDTPQQAL